MEDRMLSPYRNSSFYGQGTETSYGGRQPLAAGGSPFSGLHSGNTGRPTDGYGPSGVYGYHHDFLEVGGDLGGGYGRGQSPIRGFVAGRGSGPDRGAQSSLMSRGRVGNMGRGGGIGRGQDRGRGRGFEGDRGSNGNFRGSRGGGGNDRGRGANRGRGGGGPQNMLEQGIPDSWEALARANRGGDVKRGRGRGRAGFFTSPSGSRTDPRGGGGKNLQSRGPEYTAVQALAVSPWECKFCNMKVTGPSNLTDHMLGSKHKQVVATFVQNAAPGSPIPSTHLFCNLCKITTTNHDNLISHLSGQKHQANLLRYGKQGDSLLTKSPSKVKQSVLGNFSLVQDPLLGLELITEFLHTDPPQDPHYECKVCNLVLIGGNLVPHVMGHKHRLKYIENYRWDYYNRHLKPIVDSFVVNVGKGGEKNWEDEKNKSNALSNEVKVVASLIENAEGRQRVQSVTLRGQIRPTQAKPGDRSLTDLHSLPPTQSVSTAKKVNGSTAAKPLNPRMLTDAVIKKEYERRFGMKRPAEEAAGGPPEKKPAIPVPQKERMQYLLNELSKSTISSEEDASLALQVSNNLTQALLNYRLNSLNAP